MTGAEAKLLRLIKEMAVPFGEGGLYLIMTLAAEGFLEQIGEWDQPSQGRAVQIDALIFTLRAALELEHSEELLLPSAAALSATQAAEPGRAHAPAPPEPQGGSEGAPLPA